MVSLNLGTLKTYGNLSGYVYLHFPRFLCKQFEIIPSTVFVVSYRDGKLILEQVKEDKDATV